MLRNDPSGNSASQNCDDPGNVKRTEELKEVKNNIKLINSIIIIFLLIKTIFSWTNHILTFHYNTFKDFQFLYGLHKLNSNIAEICYSIIFIYLMYLIYKFPLVKNSIKNILKKYYLKRYFFFITIIIISSLYSIKVYKNYRNLMFNQVLEFRNGRYVLHNHGKIYKKLTSEEYPIYKIYDIKASIAFGLGHEFIFIYVFFFINKQLSKHKE